MIPFLLPLFPAVPFGTVSPLTLSEWLTEATGVPHAIGGELEDYPIFVSLHSADPTRLKTLLATALGGEWTKDGKTVRLLAIRPKKDEGREAFARAWQTATAEQPAFAALPADEVFAMRAGEIVRFGLPVGPYVRPLPAILRDKVAAADTPIGYVYVRRFSNGCFETRVDLPNEQRSLFSGDGQIEFRTLPDDVAAALGEQAAISAQDAEDRAALAKLKVDLSSSDADPKQMKRVDPLARFIDPSLSSAAKKLRQDLVIALPDFSLMTLMPNDKGTIGDLFRSFALVDDWTLQSGAFVAKLPVSERANRSQTRRAALANFIRQTGRDGVPGPLAVANYLATQRPPASECWTDVMMLVGTGVVLDQSYLGDYPFNLRLGAALSNDDWALLRAGDVFRSDRLSPKARLALLNLLVQSRQRLSSEYPDPVRWPGFPDVPLSLKAKVAEEDVLLGLEGGTQQAMEVHDAGFGYREAKKALRAEPLYRPGRRRKLTLTISEPEETAPVETGFAEVTLVAGSKSVPWTSLPPSLRAVFEAAVKERDQMPDPSPSSGPAKP